MDQRFWGKLGKPFFVLAPLADVTDAAFRRVIAKYSKPAGPAVMFTEFVSADGLMLADEVGRAKLMRDLVFTDAERPIVAQFFTANPEMMRRAAQLAVELGFDGVDINMGCPDRSIEKQGAGAALMKTPELALEIITEAKKGAGKLPVSIKTRIGYHKDELDTWLPTLLLAEPAAITLHLRTRKEMSKVPAHWEYASRAVALRDRAGVDTLMLGNGDVLSLPDAEQKARNTGLDGIMLGKAVFGNPWLFSGRKFAREKMFDISNRSENMEGNQNVSIYRYKSNGMSREPDPKQGTDTMIYHSETITIEERLRVMLEHTKLFEELLGDVKSFAIMKKHYKAYLSACAAQAGVNDFDGAKELRMKLMEAKDASEVEEIADSFLKRGVL